MEPNKTTANKHGTLIKKKIKFSSFIRKRANISPYMRRPLVIYDFATALFWISLYMRKVWFYFYQCILPSSSLFWDLGVRISWGWARRAWGRGRWRTSWPSLWIGCRWCATHRSLPSCRTVSKKMLGILQFEVIHFLQCVKDETNHLSSKQFISY